VGNIKNYQNQELRYYVILNISILLLCLHYFDISFSQENVQFVELFSRIANSTIILAVFFCFNFITDALFPKEIKEFLIYAGTTMPGEKVFSKIKNKGIDKRFTVEQVRKKYKAIFKNMPTDKKEKHRYENSEWYKIYHQYRDKTMISVSHRDFLLCRDIYCSTITTVILYTVVTLVVKFLPFDFRYILYLGFMLIASNIGTHNKANRFVSNVIAYDLGEK
jgi:hypothetical protein